MTEEFFGVETTKVNYLVLHIFLSDDPPEWLRGRPTLVDLPRFGIGRCIHIVPVSRADTIRTYSDRIVWIVENLKGGWMLDAFNGWCFEDELEALHFKLAS